MMERSIISEATKIEMKAGFNSESRTSYQAREQAGEKAFLSSVGEDRLEPQRYSSWSRLTIDAARVDRFLENCRLPAAFRREGTIQPDEVASSGMRFIRRPQQEVFKEEILAVKTKKELPNGSRLQPRRPVLSEDGVLRCDERLRYAEYLPWETRYPIILPRSHWVTTLIIKQAQEQSEHGGTNLWRTLYHETRKRKGTPEEIFVPIYVFGNKGRASGGSF